MSTLKEMNFDGYTLEYPRKPFVSAFSEMYVWYHPDWDFRIIGGPSKDSKSFALKFIDKKSDPSRLYFKKEPCHWRDIETKRYNL